MEHRKISLAVVCLVIFPFLSHCQNQGCNVQTAVPRFRRAIFDFSAKIITRVAQEELNNFVFSPLSLWTLLSSIAEGAEHQTYEELRNVLHLHRQACFNYKYYELVKGLSIKNDQVTFQRAGAIISDQTLYVKDEYVKHINALYVSRVMPLDFSDLEASASFVNSYVYEATDGIIQDAVDDDEFLESVMMLIDSVYFKGNWKVPFSSSETKLAPFHDEAGQEIGQVNLMYHTGTYNMAYMKNLNAKVLELPYGSDGRFSMLVFLPNVNEQLSNVILSFKDCTLNAIFKEFSSDEVDVSLPRFKLISELDSLKDLVRDLSITRIFDESKAELHGISDIPIYVSKILQKAEIEVTEEGTVGAAVLDAGFNWRQSNDEFTADKPFMFLVVERPTQTIIFSGAYSVPELY